MAGLDRVRVEWSGDAVEGGGVTTMYALAGDGASLSDALGTFFGSVAGYFPNSKVLWVLPTSGEVIESTNGQATGTWSGGAGGSVPSASPNASFAAGVGARIRWETSVFSNGRRVRGSTFLVPLRSDVYDTDGTLISTVASGIQTAVNTLFAAAPPVVFSRPSPGGSDGGYATTSAGVLLDKVSWLRSRRT